MVIVCCGTGCWRTALTAAGLRGVEFGPTALGVKDRRVWRRARIWAAVRVGGVTLGLGLGFGTAIVRGFRREEELDREQRSKQSVDPGVLGQDT